MSRRPWPLVILAALHVLAVPANFVMNAILSNISLREKLALSLLPANRLQVLAYVLAPIVAGIAIYICKKWSFWLYIATMIFIAASSFYGYQTKAGTISVVWPTLLMIVDVAIVSYFFIPAVRSVYFDPRLRWWETHPRYRTEFEGRWSDGSSQHTGEIGNFSAGGLFFKSAESPADDSHVTVSFVHDGTEYTFPGRVIRHSMQDRMGFGLKFVDLPEVAEKAEGLAQKLAAEGRLIKSRNNAPEDGFIPWVKKVFTKGEGLVPQPKQRK